MTLSHVFAVDWSNTVEEFTKVKMERDLSPAVNRFGGGTRQMREEQQG